MKAFFVSPVLIAVLAGAGPYPKMAPLTQYLMPNRQAEIDLARTAAPAAVSSRATALVLTASGYVVAERGTNGFTCEVERSWTKAFDDDNFWNPRVLSPVCYNAQAARSVLPYVFFLTKLALAGATEDSIHQHLAAAIAAKQLPLPENGSFAYMMSKQQYIDDSAKNWHPHVMMYTPMSLSANSGEDWGANRDGSPVVFDSNHKLMIEPWTCFFIPVTHWSDGTLGPPL